MPQSAATSRARGSALNSAAALLLAVFTAKAAVATSIDNTARAAALEAAAWVPTDGSYTFDNVGTGLSLRTTRSAVTNIFPDSESSDLYVKAHGDDTNWVRISYGNNKCISAQWDTETDGGADHAGVSYACVVDPLVSSASLEKTKQWWMLVPTTAEDSTAVSVAVKETTSDSCNGWTPNDTSSGKSDDISDYICGCSRTTAWVKKHPGYVTTLGHTECKAALESSSRLTRKSTAAKRSSTTYWIIPVDHMNDMATRGLVGTEIDTVGGYKSTLLSVLDTSDDNFKWTITAA